MKKITLILFYSWLVTLTPSCQSPQSVPERGPAVAQQAAEWDKSQPPYSVIFKRSLEIIEPGGSRQGSQPFRKIAESDLIRYFQEDPTRLSHEREQVIRDLETESRNTDPTKHLRLVPPAGQPGYSDLVIHVSHPHYVTQRRRSRLVPPADLVKAWSGFLERAKKQIILNVFDFDLMPVAELLVRKAAEGVSVQVGIDAGVIKTRPEVQRVYDHLRDNGVQVTAVRSVGLNHQKMAAIDWEDVDTAAALLSSGNLTQSCLGPEGDLIALDPRPKESIPNANHVITMRSWLLATLIHHELTKTLSPNYLLRGAQYPTTGTYQITGPGVDPNTLEAYPEPSLLITFTPGGAYRGVSKNLLTHIIDRSTGPIRMAQFAFSSEHVAQALLARAQRDVRAGGKFDFLSVSDTPFAMQDWNQFLKMSGWRLIRDEKGKRYEEVMDSPWRSVMPPKAYAKLRSNIRVAPEVYGNKVLSWQKQKYHVSAKVHHKVMRAGDFAVLGTSFNFSQNAEINNEQIVVFRSAQMADVADGIARWLHAQSVRSVTEEAHRRNRFGLPKDEIGKSPEDRQIQQEASESKREMVPSGS
jgi:phosphatidylserine/phosphatidylglycerophosphate/cardiolipin synthase-like enzyme